MNKNIDTNYFSKEGLNFVKTEKEHEELKINTIIK